MEALMSSAAISVTALAGPRRKEASMSAENSERHFGGVISELLRDREEFLMKTGNINWRLVADELNGVHYETLRKAVAGERPATPQLMELCAELVGVPPTVFAEYRLYEAQKQFDPKEVGWDQATANLREWAAAHTRPKKRRP
jgi:hypothetical protein